jgi:hypothetical protein
MDCLSCVMIERCLCRSLVVFTKERNGNTESLLGSRRSCSSAVMHWRQVEGESSPKNDYNVWWKQVVHVWFVVKLSRVALISETRDPSFMSVPDGMKSGTRSIRAR